MSNKAALSIQANSIMKVQDQLRAVGSKFLADCRICITVRDFWHSTLDKFLRRMIESTKTRRATKITYEFVALGTSRQAKLGTVCGTVRARNLPEAKRTIQGKGLYLISIELLTTSPPDKQASRSLLERLKEFFVSVQD